MSGNIRKFVLILFTYSKTFTDFSVLTRLIINSGFGFLFVVSKRVSIGLNVTGGSCLSCNNIKPIACAVPSILGFDEFISLREKLNRKLKDYCAENDITFVDLFKATADPNTGRLLERYSDDGLHLTVEGYQKIAEEIFKAFLKLLR